MISVVEVNNADIRAEAIAALAAEWGGSVIQVRGRGFPLEACAILSADEGAGLLAYDVSTPPFAEIVALIAFEPRRGLGTALLKALFERLRGQGFKGVRLAATNDNLDALRFYQKRGFRLAAVRPGAVDQSRRIKATIPRVGDYGIPIHDELDLVLDLNWVAPA